MKQLALAAAVTFALMGCATAPPMVWERPGSTPADLRRDEFRCGQLSQKTWGTIPAGPRNQTLYAECLNAHGWIGRPARADELPTR